MAVSKCAAIVVTYNRWEYLKKCIACIRSQSVQCDIIVIDNAGTDGTEQNIKTIDGDDLNYIRLKENTGGAGGFSYGIKAAYDLNYDYFWLMDDDTFPEADALERLLFADQVLKGEYGFLSSAVLWTDGTECRMNRQKFTKNYCDHPELLRYSIIEILQATFVSFFLNRKTVQTVGLPVKDFFIWGDDVEYSRRITVRNKIPSYLVGNSVVIHAMKANTGSDISTDTIERIGRYSIAYRNENFLYRQEGLKGWLFYTCRCGMHILRVIKRAGDHKIRRVFVIIRAYFGGLLFNPAIEKVSDRSDGTT